MARNMDMSDSKELGVEVGSVENALQAQASVQIDKVTRLEVRFEAPGVESNGYMPMAECKCRYGSL
jgi:hypothetical protein